MTTGSVPVPHAATECSPNKAVSTFRIMVEAYFQRNHHSLITQVYTLVNLMTRPIPEVQLATILSGRHILQVETAIIGIGCAKFTAHHHIMTWLIPEVIVVAHTISPLLPPSCHVERFIKQQEATRAIALLIA